MSRIDKKLPKDVRRETELQIEPFWNKYDGLLYYVDTKGFLVPLTQGDGSIYLSDGTLTGNRTLTGAANYLHFNSLSNFTVGTSADINLDPGGEVAIAADKKITFAGSTPTSTTYALEDRDDVLNAFYWLHRVSGMIGTFSSSGGINIIAQGATNGVEIQAGANSYTTLTNGVPLLTGANNDIADIDAGLAKVLVTKEWVQQYGPAGSGTNDYISRWTPDGNTLGDSIIQDDGTTLGIGTAPSATIHAKMVTSSLAKSIEITNTTDTASISTGVDVNNYGTLGTKIGIAAAGNPVNTDNISIGGVFIGGGGSYATTASTQYGIIVDVGANTGFTHDSYAAYITADSSNAGDNIGIYINTANAGAGTHYIGQLLDGNEGAGKVLTSDASGYVSWQTAAGVLTNIYTASGTLGGSRVVTMATNTINFSGGKVGVGVVPAGSDDFQVSGGTLLDALNINSAYFFPTTVAPANDGEALTYNAGTGGLVFAATGGTGTVTSITPAADSGSGTAITTSGTLTATGGGKITTSVTGTTTTLDWDGLVVQKDTVVVQSDTGGINFTGTAVTSVNTPGGSLPTLEVTIDQGADTNIGTINLTLAGNRTLDLDGKSLGLLNVGLGMAIGAATADASAILDLTSTTEGFLPPRMTTVQMNAVGSPATGLMVYDTTTNQWMGYNGTSWVILG